MNINRILQKLIAGVICMGIIISTIPTVIEAEYDYTGIVNLTTSLNIIPEKIVSGDFVTRKELAKYICYMLNIEDQGTVYNGDSFYDVDKSNEYYDLPFYGNFGNLTEMEIIEEFKNKENVEILLQKDEENMEWQESKQINRNLKKELKKVGEIEEFEIYVNN